MNFLLLRTFLNPAPAWPRTAWQDRRVNPAVGLTRNLLAVAAATGLLSLAGCGDGTPPLATLTLNRGLSGEPSTLDPATAADTYSTGVLLDLYEGLTTAAANGEVRPAAAESWTVDAAGTQYRFRLRQDARWSNGRPVRAEDFVAAWRRVVDPKVASPAADNFRLLAHARAILAGEAPAKDLGVSAAADGELVVDLDQPAPYLPQLLAHPSAFPIYSEASARTHQPDAWISNGPYVLAAWQPNTSLELRRNPQYWDRSQVRIERVRYQFAPDDSAQFARYRAGQLDLTDTVPANALASLRQERPNELVVKPFLATTYYGLNLTATPLAKAPGLRQALAMAIDRRRLVESLGFGQIPAYGFLPPGTASYAPRAWSWKDLPDGERIAAAKRLYAQAGFTAASPLHLRLIYNSNEAIRRTAILTAAMWHETLGVEVELIEEEYKVFLQTRHDHSRWDVARLAWSADYNDAGNFLGIFRERSPNNDFGYRSPPVDALLDQAARTGDGGARAQLLEKAEAAVLDDYPVIPVYFLVSKRLVKPYVHGVDPNPLNRVPTKSLNLDAH